MSYLIQLISVGAPADHHSAKIISSYLLSVAAGREVVALIHLGKFHASLWDAAQVLGWELRESCPPDEGPQKSHLSTYMGEVFSSVEKASRFPGDSSKFARVVVASFELNYSDLLLLRLLGKIQSPYLEIGVQISV